MNIEQEILALLDSTGCTYKLTGGIYDVYTPDGHHWDFTQPVDKTPTVKEIFDTIQQIMHEVGGCGAEPNTWAAGYDAGVEVCEAAIEKYQLSLRLED